jgi:hypothetical protein
MPSQALANELDFLDGSRDTSSGVLLECVNHPDSLGELHRIDRAKGIRPIAQRDLKTSGPRPFQRFGNVGLVSGGCQIQA